MGQKKAKSKKGAETKIPAYSLVEKAHIRWIVWTLFTVVSAVGAIKHELWQDELQAWIIARESTSLQNLIFNLRFEGHPALWHSILWISNFFTRAPEVMQVWHWVFISVAAWFIVFKSPFTLTERILILMGYFMVFEYNIIPRNYALGVLFATVILSYFKLFYQKVWLLSLSFFLMANANLYAALLASVLGAALAYFVAQENSFDFRKINYRLYVVLVCLAVGILLSALQIMPNEHNRNYLRYPEGLDYERIKFSFVNFTKVFIPIPDVSQITWWNSNIFIKNPMQITDGQFVFALILFVIPIIWLKGKKIPLIIYLSTSILVTTFTYITWVPYLRYIGHIFLGLLAAMWTDRLLHPSNSNSFRQSFKEYGFKVLLLIQALSGILAFGSDFKDKFSRVKETVNFIKQNKLDQNTIFGYTDYTTTGLCAYLNKPLFFVQRDTLGSFVFWDDKRNHFMDIKTALDSAASKIKSKPGNYLFASSMQISVNNNGVQTPLLDSVYLNYATRLVFIKKFDKAVTGNDNFYLYRLSRN